MLPTKGSTDQVSRDKTPWDLVVHVIVWARLRDKDISGSASSG